MPKIRKQPKRSSKKLRISTLRNPFLHELPYIPPQIANNLSKLEQVAPRHIDELIAEPVGTVQANLDMMKQALMRQQMKINSLKQNQAVSKKSQTQAGQARQIDKYSQAQISEKSLIEMLDLPVQVHDPDWCFQHQNQSVDLL